MQGTLITYNCGWCGTKNKKLVKRTQGWLFAGECQSCQGISLVVKEPRKTGIVIPAKRDATFKRVDTPE